MIEDVVELSPQFEELRFANINSLQNINVPVILTRRSQRIAAEITAPSGARQQSDVLRIRRIDARTAGIRISVEDRANRYATRIDSSCRDCRYSTNSRLTIRIEVRTIEIAADRIGILTIY